jgi:prepilin-type N-terminal cleavage/methylation domain-containing protein
MLIGMKCRGFTIIELIVVIAVMGILLVLGVVNLSGSQASARDAERKTDIETIATHLETFYASGTDGSINVGTYPTTDAMTGTVAQQATLRDVDINSLIAPGAPDTTNTSLVVATDTSQQQPSSSKAQNQYIYQPLTQAGTLCSVAVGAPCQKFNLYYMTEVDSIVHMVTSKNQ